MASLPTTTDPQPIATAIIGAAPTKHSRLLGALVRVVKNVVLISAGLVLATAYLTRGGGDASTAEPGAIVDAG